MESPKHTTIIQNNGIAIHSQSETGLNVGIHRDNSPTPTSNKNEYPTNSSPFIF